MAHRLPDDDPGWGSLGRIILSALLPGLAVRRAAKDPNPLVAMRSVFLAFMVAMVMIGAVVLLVQPGDEAGEPALSSSLAAVGVAVIGLAGVLLSWQVRPDQPCAPSTELAGLYRKRFFLRIAFAEISPLLGFLGVFLSHSALPFFVGLVPAALGFARAAPTRTALRRDEESLRSLGCTESLLTALNAPAPATRG